MIFLLLCNTLYYYRDIYETFTKLFRDILETILDYTAGNQPLLCYRQGIWPLSVG